MIITIAGCGALGGFFASRLIDAGFQVQAYQRKGETQDALKKGLIIKSLDLETERKYDLIAVSDDPSDLHFSELVIVLVKSYSTAEVEPVKRILKDGGVVLTLQNGIGNAETLVDIFGEEKVGAGVVHYGAIGLAPGVVQEGGGSFMAMGPWKRDVSMKWVSDILLRAGLNARYVEDPRPYLWSKLAINAMVNTTAAMTGFNNAELMANPLLVKLMKNIGREVEIAASRAGVKIDFNDIWEKFTGNVRSNIPSMLQDNMAGRKMEVDAIPGAVLNFAKDESDLPCTRTLYALLKSVDLSRGY